MHSNKNIVADIFLHELLPRKPFNLSTLSNRSDKMTIPQQTFLQLDELHFPISNHVPSV